MKERENRCKLARERAGLSAGQAARVLGVDREVITLIEAADVDDIDEELVTFAGRCAEAYGVNLEWMLGEVPRYNHDAWKGVRGYDDLSFHDRDVIAEFAASMPRGRARKPGESA
jgi:DNA-binding XRE family transcriptional regulator